MRVLVSFFLCFSLLLPGLSYAGGGGGGESALTEIVVRKEAEQTVASLVSKGKLAPSWAQVAPGEGKKEMTSKYKGHWTVVFHNPEEQDETKRTLYVFVNLEGETMRANFSGR